MRKPSAYETLSLFCLSLQRRQFLSCSVSHFIFLVLVRVFGCVRRAYLTNVFLATFTVRKIIAKTLIHILSFMFNVITAFSLSPPFHRWHGFSLSGKNFKPSFCVPSRIKPIA